MILAPMLLLAWVSGENLLIAAAEAGDAGKVRAILRETPGLLNSQDADGRTALLAATQRNHVAAAKALIEAGADVNLQDNRRDSPFLYAGAAGYLEILKLAWKAGANTRVTNRYGGIALIPACERGHVETVEFLLEHTDSNVNHVNNLGWTALLEAIVLSDGGPRHQRIVRLLLDHGARRDLGDRDGITPLEHARRRGFREIAAMLER